MPVGLYVNNTSVDGTDADGLKNVLSQLYTSSSPSCSSVSSSSADSRLDSRPVVFVVLTQNELNNLNASKLNIQLNELQFVEHNMINKENSQVSQIDDDQINYMLSDESFEQHQQQNEQNATKNNIDYAIDAVVAKCRQPSPEPSAKTIPNVYSELKIDKKICKKVLPRVVEMDESQQSKSTKARTSYISSLIANRSRIVDDKPSSISNEKTKNLHTLLTSKSNIKSSQVLIQPKPVVKPILPNNQPDFVLNKSVSNLSRLLSGELAVGGSAVNQPIDYDRLEKNLCDTDRVQLKLIEIKSKLNKKSKNKRRIEEPNETYHLDQLDQSPSSSRPKKLKTIADIVKHQANNNNQQQKSLVFNQPNLIETQQQHYQQLQIQQLQQQQQHHHQQNMQENNEDEEMNNQDLTITWINQNQLINNIQYSNETDHLNMENLLELELNHDQNSPIDKFIDLDEIDVNPLDYRSGAQIVCNQMDEFNLQFSVCSSGSSGFSEPSNFSCSSSISSASNLGYANAGSNVLSVNSINNLFSPDDSSPCTYQSYDHNSPYQSSYNMTNSQHMIANQTLDWSMIDLADKSAHQHNISTVNCGENMFANFNFFNDEIKLEI